MATGEGDGLEEEEEEEVSSPYCSQEVSYRHDRRLRRQENTTQNIL
jgi:hypothetical protein